MSTDKVKAIPLSDGDLGLQLRRVTRGDEALRHQTARDTIVLFFGWLNATDNGLKDYFELYERKGLDVLFIPGQVKYFAWPPSCKTFCLRLLDILCSNLILREYKYFLFHGVSIGCYEYTNCLMLARANQEKYGNFLDKLQGLIFDSATYGSYERMKNGVSRGLTKNELLRAVIPNVLTVLFFFMKKYTVGFFEKAMHVLEECPHDAPTVAFYCRNDPMCDPDMMTRITNDWRKKIAHPVLAKCWDKSSHAAHLRRHRNEYTDIFNKFLEIYIGRLKCKL